MERNPAPIFRLERTGQKTGFHLVSVAHAAYCTGLVECEPGITACHCPDGSSCDFGGAPYQYGGNCKCTFTCSGLSGGALEDYYCSSNTTELSCTTSAGAAQICQSLGLCKASDCTWVSDGGGTTPTPTPAPSCNCGKQQCDYNIPTCKCLDIGCKTSTGANCIKYTCGGSTPVYNPIGYHDSSYCDYSYGWTCDQDNFSTPILVKFYKDGPPGTGTFIGSTLANVAAERIGF